MVTSFPKADGKDKDNDQLSSMQDVIGELAEAAQEVCESGPSIHSGSEDKQPWKNDAQKVSFAK